jgi:hypothetical protein
LEILPSHSLGKEEILPRVGAREVVEPETCSSSNSKFLTLYYAALKYFLAMEIWPSHSLGKEENLPREGVRIFLNLKHAVQVIQVFNPYYAALKYFF